MLHPRERSTDVPVQVVQPARDKFVRAALADDLHHWVTRLWRRTVHAGHWAPVSRPDVVGRVVEEFVDHVEGALGHPRAAPGAARRARAAGSATTSSW